MIFLFMCVSNSGKGNQVMVVDMLLWSSVYCRIEVIGILVTMILSNL